jgi:hypothetical protein
LPPAGDAVREASAPLSGQLDGERNPLAAADAHGDNTPFTHRSAIKATNGLYIGAWFGIMSHEARRAQL